jgi:uncharacterized OB-fold protein
MKFGEISYEDYPELTTNFVTELKSEKLMYNACSGCDEKYFPPRTACTNFHSPGMMEMKPLEETSAVLKAFTIIHFAPDSHADKAPYVVAIGELAGGFRVLAHLTGVTSMPKVGMPLTLKIQQVGPDRAYYKFIKG